MCQEHYILQFSSLMFGRGSKVEKSCLNQIYQFYFQSFSITDGYTTWVAEKMSEKLFSAIMAMSLK